MSTGREPSSPSTPNGDRPDADGHRFPVAWSPSPSQRAGARHAANVLVLNRAPRRMSVLVKAVAAGDAHWLDLHLPLVGVQTVTLPGGSIFRLRVNETSHSSTAAPCRRGFGAVEPDVAPVFAALAARSDVVLDVGANIGAYAMAAAILNPEAEVVAFEPLPDFYERLLANALLNGLEHVICVNAAVSDGAGAATLFAPAGRVATTASQEVSHRLRHPHERAHEPGPYACHIVAADRPHIICELFPQSWIQRDVGAEIEALLAPHDYFLYLLTDQGLQHCPHISGNRDHLNHLFTPLAPHELAELIDRPVEV